MDTITGKILKLNGWPDGKIIGIAKKIGEQLREQGSDRETILARLNAVRQNPGPFLADELMAGGYAAPAMALASAERRNSAIVTVFFPRSNAPFMLSHRRRQAQCAERCTNGGSAIGANASLWSGTEPRWLASLPSTKPLCGGGAPPEQTA